MSARVITAFVTFPPAVQAARHMMANHLAGLEGRGVPPYHTWPPRWNRVAEAIKSSRERASQKASEGAPTLMCVNSAGKPVDIRQAAMCYNFGKLYGTPR